MKWNKKDLLGLEDLSREEIEIILETARSFKEVSARPVKKVPALRGKTVVNLFLSRVPEQKHPLNLQQNDFPRMF